MISMPDSPPTIAPRPNANYNGSKAIDSTFIFGSIRIKISV
jgi:hypothetical protein